MEPLNKDNKKNMVGEERIFLLTAKFILIWISIFTILYGWEKKDSLVSNIGSFIFILALILDLYRTYVLSKEYVKLSKDEIYKPTQNDDGFSKIISFFEGIVILCSFVGILVFKGKEDYYFYPCMIIWLGAILAYYLNGAIVREVTNMPLRFYYGSWKLKYPKRRRRKY